MEIEMTTLEVVVATLAVIAFAVAYWKVPKFRNTVNAYVKKAYREYKDEIYMYADAYLDSIAKDLDVDVSLATHKYIKNEVLRAAVEAKLDLGVAHADEWVKMKYKEVLEDLMRKQ